MLSSHFRPKKSYELIRVGPKEIGGFIFEKIAFEKCDILLSFGIASDISCEIDFFKKKNVKIHCYDHTISRRSWNTDIFIKSIFLIISTLMLKFNKTRYYHLGIKNLFQIINFYNNKKVKFFFEAVGYGKYGVSFKKTISRASSRNICLKINIEHSEYRILDEIIKYKNKIGCLVIEFHDIDIHKHLVEKFIKKLEFTLVHVAVSGADYSGKNIPSAITVALSKYKKITSNSANYPNKYDHKVEKKNKFLIDLAKSI